MKKAPGNGGFFYACSNHRPREFSWLARSGSEERQKIVKNLLYGFDDALKSWYNPKGARLTQKY